MYPFNNLWVIFCITSFSFRNILVSFLSAMGKRLWTKLAAAFSTSCSISFLSSRWIWCLIILMIFWVSSFAETTTSKLFSRDPFELSDNTLGVGMALFSQYLMVPSWVGAGPEGFTFTAELFVGVSSEFPPSVLIPGVFSGTGWSFFKISFFFRTFTGSGHTRNPVQSWIKIKKMVRPDLDIGHRKNELVGGRLRPFVPKVHTAHTEEAYVLDSLHNHMAIARESQKKNQCAEPIISCKLERYGWNFLHGKYSRLMTFIGTFCTFFNLSQTKTDHNQVFMCTL